MVSANTGSVNNTANISHRNSLSASQAQPLIQANKPQSAPTIFIDVQSGKIQSNAVEISSLKSSSSQTLVFKTSIDQNYSLSRTDSHYGLQSNSTPTNDIKPQHIVDSSSVNSYGLKTGPLNLSGVLNRTPIQLQVTNAPAETTASTEIVGSTVVSGVNNTQPPAVDNQPTISPVADTNTTVQNSSVDDSVVTEDTQASNHRDDTAEQQVEQQEAAKQQIELAETKQINQLAQRDTEVKTHEQAHAAVGGSLAQTPSYQYETGPDGRRYAVEGEVNIDVSTVDGDAQATLTKMQKVYAAAMAPVQPSMADIRVAAQALQNMNEAKKELTTNNSDSLSSTAMNNSISPNSQVLTNDALNVDDVNQGIELLASNHQLLKYQDQSSDQIINDITSAQSIQQHQSFEIYV